MAYLIAAAPARTRTTRARNQMPHRKENMPEMLDESQDISTRYYDEEEDAALLGSDESYDDAIDDEDEARDDGAGSDSGTDDDDYDDDYDDGYGDEEEDGDREELAELASGLVNNENTERLFEDCEYLSVPKIPEQYRASDIIGMRTQARDGSNKTPIGKINNKAKLANIWKQLTDVEKYILMLISEHRHMTQAQLGTLIIPASSRKKAKGGSGGFDATKSYYEWVTKVKYAVSGMSYKATFKTGTHAGLENKIKGLVDLGLLAEIQPAYDVDKKITSERYKETPALFTQHYYLTPLGAKVLIVNTDVNRDSASEKPVGYVPTYKKAAYQTILHEAESTEIFCSLISCAQFASNPDDERDFGIFDVCRFYHEKDIEEKGVEYKGKKIDFKTDGKLTMYVDSIGDFLDWYIEYDSGSSSSDKIKHKTEAFIKYIFWKRQTHGERFRKPVLLLVSQKPADLFPQLKGNQRTTYTTGIKNMVHENFEEYLHVINDIAIVLVADCASIRNHGALGACWHKVDLTTGIADLTAYDLITASRGISASLAAPGSDASPDSEA